MAKSQTGQATNKSNAIYQNAQDVIQPVVGGLRSRQGATSGFQMDTGSEAKAGFEQQQVYGGYDPNQLGGLRTNAQQFTQTGGYDPNQLATITGGYGDFAKTGGYDPASSAAFINAATSGVESSYDVIAQQEQRKRAAQGLGMGGGEYLALARQGGEVQKQADLEANVALQKEINANKLAGLGGLRGTAADVAGAKQTGFGQQLGLESGVAAGSRAGSQGLQGLYNTATGEITQEGQQILSALGLQFGTQADAISFLTALSKNPGAFQTGFTDFTNLVAAAQGAPGIRQGIGG